jgi:hypothetical protein
MRLVSWALGLVLGAILGGSALVIGVLAALLLVPAVVWGARERARPAGLGGVLIGAGGGPAGLLALANARCAASNVSTPNYVSECVAPDLTVYLVVAAALALVGVAVSIVALTRTTRVA